MPNPYSIRNSSGSTIHNLIIDHANLELKVIDLLSGIPVASLGLIDGVPVSFKIVGGKYEFPAIGQIPQTNIKLKITGNTFNLKTFYNQEDNADMLNIGVDDFRIGRAFLPSEQGVKLTYRSNGGDPYFEFECCFGVAANFLNS